MFKETPTDKPQHPIKEFKCFRCKLVYSQCKCYYKCPVCDCYEFVGRDCKACEKNKLKSNE